MEISKLYKLYCETGRVSKDSRDKNIGGIFFALGGENFDGNKFALQAIENGCKYAIIDNAKYKIDNRFIIVKDVLTTLQQLASYHREKIGIPILSITGTNGKTTTKELVSSILSEKYNVIATKGNLNNHIGVPLTLLSMNNETELGVVEMGANHQNEISNLCDIAKPNYGIITNIGKAHLEGFGSFNNVKKAKTELYEYINSKNGVIFYNDNNELLNNIASSYNCRKIKYSDYENVKLLDSKPFLKIIIGKNDIKTKLIGDYNLENIQASVSIGRFFNISIKNICKKIESYIPKNNRSQLINTNNNIVFLDAYNANPTSVKLALESFDKQNFTNKAIILGEMLELGDNAIKEHINVLEQIKNYNIKNVFLIGEIFHIINSD
nr:UDP-N-acetylmuramoyl-tripeptide--D-alanyl-D-alanine ligase [Bacteroidales bacterium]